MAYSEHSIIETDIDGLILCSCGASSSKANYANHVAAMIVQGLTERCAQAEESLGKQGDEKDRSHPGYGPIAMKFDYIQEVGRLKGKKAGVALARSYIEEVMR